MDNIPQKSWQQGLTDAELRLLDEPGPWQEVVGITTRMAAKTPVGLAGVVLCTEAGPHHHPNPNPTATAVRHTHSDRD